jgi:hypothetical protein
MVLLAVRLEDNLRKALNEAIVVHRQSKLSPSISNCTDRNASTVKQILIR